MVAASAYADRWLEIPIVVFRMVRELQDRPTGTRSTGALRIPQDVAIVSFDGTVDSLYTWPQLTTMQQDTAKIAACAMKAALTPDETPDVQLIKASLVVRHSCGC